MRKLLYTLGILCACGSSFGNGKIDLLKKIVNSEKFGELRDSVNIDLDREDAKSMLREASRNVDLKSLQSTAMKLWQGTSREDRRRGFALMQQAAKQGNPDALYFIGNLLQKGEGLAKNPQEAIKWLGRSAAQGHALSQASMGKHFFEGEDFKKAYTWLSVAVANGATPENMKLLQEASKHLTPEQLQAAQSLAKKLVTKYPGTLKEGAVIHDIKPDTDIQELMQGVVAGATGDDGDSVAGSPSGGAETASGGKDPNGSAQSPQDSVDPLVEAAKAPTKPEPLADYVQVMQSAWDGDPKAQFQVASMFHYGTQVAKDHKTAMKWYMSSATKGNPEAQSRLGLMYFNGQGSDKDWVSAYAWFAVAAANKDSNADKLRLAISQRLPPDQLTTAHNLAQQLVNQYPGLLMP